MQLTALSVSKIVADISKTGATFDAAKVFVGVATGINDRGADTTIADLEVPQGALAVREPVTTWGTPHKLISGSWAVDSPVLTFKPASATESATLTEWYLADALTAGNLLAFGDVYPPAGLEDQNMSWSIVVRLCVDPSGQWSAEVQWNG